MYAAIGVSGSAALIALVMLPFAPQPALVSAPYLLASCALQVVYTVLVAKTYQVSDMSQTYPLMRGTAPLLVAAISVLFLGDRLSPLAWLGIGVICLAILAMAFNGRASSRKGIVLALINACFIAGYTLVDGTGVRLAGSGAGLHPVDLFYERLLPACAGRWWRDGVRPVVIYVSTGKKASSAGSAPWAPTAWRYGR
ncbi:integral membrane protein [Klebsiella pneumoniae]|uniref:Integral membrane protein n=1 Tax=Klebsiella pneumoniae TaxID=573 RepID=A0A4P0YIW0_KLEPN|nr:integral membrane protein [Klebsiella pneumoniae]